MLNLSSPQRVHQTILQWKKEGQRIAFVPTLGNLHRAHLKLVDEAKRLGDRTVVSIFVNPLQFGPNEDFERYPRTPEADETLLEEKNVDLLFAPTREELYPEGFGTRVVVSALGEPLCGVSRPGHFEGVATVCLKLFQISQADFAIFGKKDFQQLRVVQQLTEDMNLPLKVVAHAIVRESDGLAVSSRNRYLTEPQRELARRIPGAVFAVSEAARRPGVSVGELRSLAREKLGPEGIVEDYLAVGSEVDLVPCTDSKPLEKNSQTP